MKSKFFLLLAFSVIVLSSWVSAAECGSSPSTPACTVSVNTVFDGLAHNINSTVGNMAINVNGTGVTLDCNNSIIYGNQTANSRGIYVNVQNVTLINCNLREYDQNIRTDSSGDYLIVNGGSIGNALTYGIRYASDDLIISNSIFTESNASLYYLSASLDNITVINVSFTNDRATVPAINLAVGPVSQIINSSFRGFTNALELTTNTNGTLVSGCTFNNSGLNSIDLSNSWNNILTGNRFNNNNFNSIDVLNSNNNTISFNNILNSSLGIVRGTSKNTSIYNNTGYSTSDHSIELGENSSYSRVYFNNFSNGANQVNIVDNSSHNLVFNNSLYNSTGSRAIGLLGGENNSANGNYIFITNSTGIEVRGTNLSNIMYNNFSRVASNSIDALRGYNNTISYNNFLNLKFNSIDLNGGNNNIISFNTMTNSSLVIVRGFASNTSIYNNSGYSTRNYAMDLTEQSNKSYVYFNNFTNGVNQINVEQNSSNNEIFRNYIRNATNYRGIGVLGGLNNSVHDNYIDIVSTGIEVRGNARNTTIYNNLINNTWNNFDGWNTGILGHPGNGDGGSYAVDVYNNTLDNMGCMGFKVTNGSYWSVSNNTINLASISLRQSVGVRCVNEVSVGIAFLENYRTFPDTSSEIVDYVTLNFTDYNTRNVIVKGNTFNNFAVKARFQGTKNYSHDLSNYWFRSFSAPLVKVGTTFVIDRDDMFMDNNFNNISNVNFSSVYNTYVGQGWQRADGDRINILTMIFKDFSLFNNTNSTLFTKNLTVVLNVSYNVTYTIGLYNQTNSLIYYDNGSTLCTDLSTCDGDMNVSLAPSNYSIVLDNYNLTENINRMNNPIWFHASSAVSKDIKSNLSNSVIVPILLSTPSNCSTVSRLSYDGATSSALEYFGADARAICTNLTTVGQQFMVDPTGGGSDNLLTFFTEPGSATYACDLLDIRCILVNELIGSPTMAMILAVLAFCLLAAKMRLGFETTITLAVPIVLGFAVVIYGFSIIYGFATFIAGLMVALAFLRLWGNK